MASSNSQTAKPDFDVTDHNRAEVLGGHGEQNAMEAAATRIEEAKSGKNKTALKNPPPEGEDGTGFSDA